MQIERDNKILLEKMTNIMTKKQNDVHFVYNSKFWNNIYIYIYIDENKKSLNGQMRKSNLLKITQENQIILKRIKDQSARYSQKRIINENRFVRQQLKTPRVLENPINPQHTITLSRSSHSYVVIIIFEIINI